MYLKVSSAYHLKLKLLYLQLVYNLDYSNSYVILLIVGKDFYVHVPLVKNARKLK